ncbi:MAG: S46 family peptidase [Planctomycetes bacterium]|nr:S46 family peptidase [Planctomycetota bacterium]
MHAKLLLLFLSAVVFLPDEGQWLPTQIRDWDWDALKKRGMAMTRDEFWHPERGGVLSATVQINGCTASFVSADGLLVTNHHCGFGAVSELSTPEHNWLRDGFAAKDKKGELPAPGMTAAVLKRIDDITATVHAAQAKATSDLERQTVTQQVLAQEVARGEQAEPNTRCSVASFLEGKEYHLYYRTQITDVRLVYAPPRAIGEFGGEVDNWEWPRHTGDFTFFRAYVGPDGNPRPHDEANVPFVPQHKLAVCTDGIQQGDLAIIMGYPGNTQRYKSSRAVATRQGYIYPRRDAVLTAAIAAYERAGKTSEAMALAVADRIKSLANTQKNAQGMIFGLRHNGTVDRKLREEAALTQWIAADPGRQAKWGSVLAELLSMDEEEAATIQQDTTLGFINMLSGDIPLLAVLMQACAALADGNGKLPQRALKTLGGTEIDADLELLQLPLLAVLLEEIASLPDGNRLTGSEALGGGTGDEIVTRLRQQSQMFAADHRRDLFAQGRDGVMASTDPLIVLARGLVKDRAASQVRNRARQGRMLVTGRAWIEAQEAFRGKAFYPDANSTLRVSLAEVKGYKPRDGITYTPHTTVQGLLDKETGKEPFANPPALLEAARTRKDSRWFDPRIGDVPVCFLADGDTTGGNSGSPVVNGKGQLIGLNFDRVFEAVAGDFGWNADRSRNVICDIRYVLWVVESVFPSPALLQELVGTAK